MAEGDARVPAGWYPDPLGLPQLRWWDNHTWTEYTSDAREPMVVDDAGASVGGQGTSLLDDGSAARRARQERAAGATATLDVEHDTVAPSQETLDSLAAPESTEQRERDERSPADRFAEFVPAPSPLPASERFADLVDDQSEPPVEGSASPAARRISINDAAVWILALLPIAQITIALFVLLAQTDHAAGPAFAISLFGVPWLAGVVLAAVDHSTLRRRGIGRPASWAWALLGTPVYLVARMVRTLRAVGRGIGPLAGWLATTAAVGLSVLLVPGLVISLAPDVFARQAEDSLEARAAALGADIVVSCPDEMPIMPGGEVTCIANRGPLRWGISVRLERANGWIDWHVEQWGIFTARTGS